MCGEYGEGGTRRPHYHACIFNADFPDKVYFKKSETGEKLYTSETLTRLWPHGHSTTGQVTFNSAAYVARYIMKKVTGEHAEFFYEEIDQDTGELVQLVPEFNHMSLKPGIGAGWLERYEADVYPQGKVVVRGHESRSPRYYDQRYKQLAPEIWEQLAWSRQQEGIKRHADNTPERLAVRETVAKAKIKKLKRSLT